MEISENAPGLYVMLSRTDTGMGRLIRAVCRYPYNHVSLSLDADFSGFVSFARYVRDTPLYGGFIRETPERYLADGRDVRVRIFRLEISQNRRRELAALFSRAGEEGLIYNTYDALACALGGSFPLPGADTCLSFACRILNVRAKNLQALDEILSPYLVFEGDLSALVTDSGDRTDPYFAPLGFWRGAGCTIRHFARLTGRIFRRNHPDIQ